MTYRNLPFNLLKHTRKNAAQIIVSNHNLKIVTQRKMVAVLQANWLW